MSNLTNLDNNTILPNAESLWDRRGTPTDARSLKNLEEEYYAAVGAGLWTPAPKVPFNFDPLNEPYCDYLDEFRLVREGIVNKTMEFEEKTDFNRWILNGNVDCPLTTSQFNDLIDSLFAEVSSIENQRNTNLDLAFQDINSAVGGLN